MVAGVMVAQMVTWFLSLRYRHGKPDSFRRARTRHPIPGETRTSDGRPAWTSAALRDWHAQRNAGSRTPERESD
jgi:hypothetical protein